jgi:1,4-dihydroxy-6-naphthoate synthase
MEIEIAFSPCPNDTFIFDALIHQKIDTSGIQFKPVLMDVQGLNESAIKEKYPVTKISYGVYPRLIDKYVILDSGSALGFGVGPLLISSDKMKNLGPEETAVAIPGIDTTAHVLFSSAFPEVKKKVFFRYDDIESFVIANKGMGVIIHENRFTYAEKGLHKICDLGEVWEEKTGMPIPLGGIVASRKLDKDLTRKIETLIAESIAFARGNYPQLSDFVIANAQEMNERVMRNHIDLYVNDYSMSLNESGRQAIRIFLEHCDIEKQSTFTDYFL